MSLIVSFRTFRIRLDANARFCRCSMPSGFANDKRGRAPWSGLPQCIPTACCLSRASRSCHLCSKPPNWCEACCHLQSPAQSGRVPSGVRSPHTHRRCGHPSDHSSGEGGLRQATGHGGISQSDDRSGPRGISQSGDPSRQAQCPFGQAQRPALQASAAETTAKQSPPGGQHCISAALTCKALAGASGHA